MTVYVYKWLVRLSIWVNETLKTLRSMTSITILLGNASKLVHTHKYWRYSNIPHLHTCVEWTVRASSQHIYLLNSGKDFHLSMTMHRSMWENGHLGVFSCFSGTHFELMASNGNASATFNDELIFDEYFVGLHFIYCTFLRLLPPRLCQSGLALGCQSPPLALYVFVLYTGWTGKS